HGYLKVFPFKKSSVLVTAHTSLILIILGSALFFPIYREMIPRVYLWQRITQRCNQFKSGTQKQTSIKPVRKQLLMGWFGYQRKKTYAFASRHLYQRTL